MEITVGVVSLGCSKNTVDTEQMLGELTEKGYTLVQDPAKAQVLIVNTCGFIQSAKEESIEAILDMASFKNPGKGTCEKLVVTGCLAQRYEKELMAEIPEIDLLFGVNQYDLLAKGIDQAFSGKRMTFTQRRNTFFENKRLLTTPPYMGYVRIGDGCDNRCAFCAIPLIRGSYRSRSEGDILNEVKALAQRGVKEHIFIAQDTTRYGTEGAQGSQLPQLLQKAAQIDGVDWLRVLYCYPDGTDENLLNTISQTKNICNYLDLPIQHIDEDLLVKMRRRGSPDEIKHILRMARERNIALRTTLIVGFPGETEDAFKRLYDFVGEQEFDHLGAFAYSPEEGTTAAKMDGQLPEEVKAHRLDQIMTLQQKISKKRNQMRVGTKNQVLVTKQGQNGLYHGRSMWEAPDIDGEIVFTSPKALKPGDFVRVHINQAKAYDLLGEIHELT